MRSLGLWLWLWLLRSVLVYHLHCTVAVCDGRGTNQQMGRKAQKEGMARIHACVHLVDTYHTVPTVPTLPSD